MFEDITHPFLNINDLSELSIEDLQTKISEVLSRLNFCCGTNNQQLINIPVNKNGEAVADIRYNNNLYYIKRNIPGIKDFTTQDLIFAVNYIKKLKKNYYISIINVYDRLLTGVDEYFQNQINSHLMNGGHIFVKKMKIEKTIIILNIKKRLYILKLLLDKQNQKEEEF